MKKNQKILVAVLAIVIVLAVVIFAIAMNKNTNEEVSSTNDVTSVSESVESTEVESSTEVIASIGTAPEDSQSSVDKSDAINFPGSETSETSTSESATDSSNTESSASKTESTTESTTSETSASKTETSASSTSETSTSESSTSKTSTSAEPTTSETTPSTPVDNSSSTPAPGEQITQGSTGTTSLGTTYPIVSEFNKLGLDSNSVSFGSADGSSNDFAKAFGQANRAISDVLGYPSDFTAISVTSTYINCLDAHISRKPESGYYVWVYAADITDTTDGGASSRALHQVMLGAITSTPAEVENALFEAMWGDDPYNIGSCQWVTVGDCQILYGYGEPDPFRYEFLIKPAN